VENLPHDAGGDAMAEPDQFVLHTAGYRRELVLRMIVLVRRWCVCLSQEQERNRSEEWSSD
jgi:hypothetical protein